MKIIVFVRNGEVKMQLPTSQVVFKDSTLWYKGNPIINHDGHLSKAQLSKLVSSKQFEKIPTEHFAHLGDNGNGLWIGDITDWMQHPEQLRQEKEKQETVSIHLSTRGWGDYSSVEWVGNITQPDAIILAECKTLLSSSTDVDHILTDEKIIVKITEARSKWHQKQEKPVQKIVTHGPGYCYSCDSYCYGDCGHFTPKPTFDTLKKYNL